MLFENNLPIVYYLDTIRTNTLGFFIVYGFKIV